MQAEGGTPFGPAPGQDQNAERWDQARPGGRDFPSLPSKQREARVVELPRGRAEVVWIGMDGYLRSREVLNRDLAQEFAERVNCTLAIAEWFEECERVASLTGGALR
jgi:hypothetical protein